MELSAQIINNRYQLLNKIGEGEMGVVYRAQDLEKNFVVALKMMKEPVTSSYVEDLIRFKREMELVSKFDHPNLVKISDWGEFGKRPFIVMEFLEGENFSLLLKRGGKLSIDEVLQVMRQLLEGLIYAHGREIWHRDLKPSNIFICQSKEKYSLKLGDFGVAFIMELRELQKEDVISIFGYMSPEATGISHKHFDERSDLYSLGIIFYQLLTGKLPFEIQEVNKLIYHHIAVAPPLITPSNPLVTEILEKVIMKLLHKDPDLRYQSAKGLLFDLEKIQRGEQFFNLGEKDKPPKLTYRSKFVGREWELGRIKALINNATKSLGGIGLISGEAGMGKSALAYQVRNYVYQQKGLFLEGRFLDQENRAPYQAFQEIANIYVNNFEKMDQENQNNEKKRLKAVVGELGEILIKFNSKIETILGRVKKLVPLDLERENQRVLMVLAEFFCHLSREDTPLVLFLDDMQWMDDGSLSLLTQITYRLPKTNLVVIGTYRHKELYPDHLLQRYIQEFRKKGAFNEEIRLLPFENSEVKELINNALGSKEGLSNEMIAYINNLTEGNPFFIINVIRELIEEQGLVWREGFWEEDLTRIKNIAISKSLVEIILKRIDGLTEDLTQIMCLGAVIGRVFQIELLFNLVNATKDGIVALIDEAIRLQLIEQGKERGEFAFVHDRIREAFFSKRSQEERQVINGRIARALEELNKDHKEKVLFDLVRHYLNAANHDKALEYLIPAALKAKASYANEESIRYYQTALEILENNGLKHSSLWLEACEGLVEIYLVIGENEKVIAIAAEILSLKDGIRERDKAKLYKIMGMAWFKKGDWVHCEINLIKGLELLGEKVPQKNWRVLFNLFLNLLIHLLHSLFPQIFVEKIKNQIRPEDKEIIGFYVTLNWVYILSDLKKFVCNTLRMLNLAESRLDKSVELGLSLSCYAALCMAIPFFKRSIKYHHKALELRQELEDEWGQAQCYQWLGFCYLWRGEHDQSLDYFEESRKKYELIGDLWETGMVLNGIGHCYRYVGNYQRGIPYFEKYLEISERIEDDYGFCSSGINVALGSGELKGFMEKGELLEKVLKISNDKEIWFMNCNAHIFTGILEYEKGNFTEAVRHLEAAKKLYDTFSFIPDHIIFLYSYLVEVYIARFQKEILPFGYKNNQKELRRIKTICEEGLRKTKPWQNHYGAILRAAAKYYALLKKERQAEAYFLMSMEQTRLANRKYEFAVSCYEYGIFLNDMHRPEKAQLYLEEAYHNFKKIGAEKYYIKCLKLLGYTEEQEKVITRNDRLTLDRKMMALLTVSSYLSSILDLNELLNGIIEKAVELMGAERGVLLLYGEENPAELELKVVKNASKEDFDNFKVSVSGQIIAQVVAKQKPLIIKDGAQDATLAAMARALKEELNSVLCVPILVKREVIGIIYLDNRMVKGLFNDGDLEILNILGSHAGVSIENARLYRQAVIDGLTGIYNRAFLDNFLIKSIDQAQRYKKPLSILLIDIDYFKKVNDTYGHDVGDLVLKKTAQVMKKLARKSDLLARYGGEEFVVVLTETNLNGAKNFAEKLRKAVAENSIKIELDRREISLRITVSIGVTESGDEQRLALLKNAYNALYLAKEKGRNRVETEVSL